MIFSGMCACKHLIFSTPVSCPLVSWHVIFLPHWSSNRDSLSNTPEQDQMSDLAQRARRVVAKSLISPTWHGIV
jgi:hypothetical protein